MKLLIVKEPDGFGYFVETETEFKNGTRIWGSNLSLERANSLVNELKRRARILKETK